MHTDGIFWVTQPYTVTIQADWYAAALATTAQTAPSQPAQQRLGPLSPETSTHRGQLDTGAQATCLFWMS